MSCYSQSFACEHQRISSRHPVGTMFELHFMYQGAEETKVCGDGAGIRCAGSTDQRHEHTAESASHASGTLAADGATGARHARGTHCSFVAYTHCLGLACMNQVWFIGRPNNSLVTMLPLYACHPYQPQRHIPEEFVKTHIVRKLVPFAGQDDRTGTDVEAEGNGD